MKKNQIADLSSISKLKIDQPSADTKKKEEIKKKQKQGLISQEMAMQLTSQKSYENEGLNAASPSKRLQNQQSQETSNATNAPPPQPPKPKKKLKSILVPDEASKKNRVIVIPPSEERKDHFGSAITKGQNKHHKIYFNPQIQEVYEVENWKEYNLEEKYGICACRCKIFQMTLLAILAM